MRRPFTTQDALRDGITDMALRWKVRSGRCIRVYHGVYLDGADPPTPDERARCLVVAVNGVASHFLAGRMHGLDSVDVCEPVATVPRRSRSRHDAVRRRDLLLDAVTEVDGYRCTSGLRTLVDLAGELDDVRWEHALESALRQELTTIDEITSCLTSGLRGGPRIRRVLAARPPGAPATESLLETLMVQLIRAEPRLPTPERQVEVFNRRGTFVGRVDLAWPDRGVFIELDGQQHEGQPVYDARRETAVVAATGWLPGRFTWHEVTRVRRTTARRVLELLEAARRPAA